MNTVEKAVLLIASVRAAVKNGVKHYALDGRFLETPADILRALQADKEISMDMRDRVEIVTVEEEMTQIKQEHPHIEKMYET